MKSRLWQLFLSIVLLTGWLPYAMATNSPLPADKAFPFTVKLQPNQLILQWDVADGYYLYASKFKISPLPLSKVKTKLLILPNKNPLVTGRWQIIVPFYPASGKLLLKVGYQGCSSQGFCYAPVTQLLKVTLKNQSNADLTPYLVKLDNKKAASRWANKQALGFSQNPAQSLLAGQHWGWILLGFLGLGVLLAFTPCVLPMIPILSSIIVGVASPHSSSKIRAFSLSLAYVAGMALTYALAGIVMASVGNEVQIWLHKPIVLVLYSIVFFLLALSMFDLYQLKLPARWQQPLLAWVNRYQGGTYVSVFCMGALSILIVSPCVSAPLAGVLTYIAGTGNAFLGGIALLMLGIGMGLPLLLIGASAEKLLPKVGPWMEYIKKLFGILLLGIAVWLLWGTLNPSSSKDSLPFQAITTTQQFEDSLKLSSKSNKPILLDFYADWCSSCVRMDKQVFDSAEVKKALQNFILLRVDVTVNNDFNRVIQQTWGVMAPPVVLVLYNGQGRLQKEMLVGEMNADEFLRKINQVRSQLCHINDNYC